MRKCECWGWVLNRYEGTPINDGMTGSIVGAIDRRKVRMAMFEKYTEKFLNRYYTITCINEYGKRTYYKGTDDYIDGKSVPGTSHMLDEAKRYPLKQLAEKDRKRLENKFERWKFLIDEVNAK